MGWSSSPDKTQTGLNFKELLKRRERAIEQGKDTTMLDRMIQKHQKAFSSWDKKVTTEASKAVNIFHVSVGRGGDIDYPTKRDRSQYLTANGIPHKMEHSHYEDHVKITVPVKYGKKAAKLLGMGNLAGSLETFHEGNSGNPNIDALKNEFANYDYWYEMSDDHRYWKKGVASDERIAALIQQLGLGKEDVARLWQEAGRKEDIPLAKFGLAPKKMYTVGSALKNEEIEEAYSDPSGLWSAATNNAGKQKMWKVYYSDPSNPGNYQTKKFKTRPGGKEDDVIVHFQKKFPGFKINFVEMIGYVGESKRTGGPRAKRVF